MKSQIILLSIMSIHLCQAQFQPTYYQQGGEQMPYQIRFPKDYDAEKQYPLLLFLHGAGERGNDNQRQLTFIQSFLENNQIDEYQSIVILPQCPENSYWSNVKQTTINSKRFFQFDYTNDPSQAMNLLLSLLDDWLDSGKIDPQRVYVGGLSMGGMGTFELLYRRPNLFAAAFPICGGGDVNCLKDQTKGTAIWIFHGAEDEVVSVSFSQEMYAALLESGADVRYSEYEGVGHNSWDSAFAEKSLLEWIFNQKREN